MVKTDARKWDKNKDNLHVLIYKSGKYKQLRSRGTKKFFSSNFSKVIHFNETWTGDDPIRLHQIYSQAIKLCQGKHHTNVMAPCQERSWIYGHMLALHGICSHSTCLVVLLRTERILPGFVKLNTWGFDGHKLVQPKLASWSKICDILTHTRILWSGCPPLVRFAPDAHVVLTAYIRRH